MAGTAWHSFCHTMRKVLPCAAGMCADNVQSNGLVWSLLICDFQSVFLSVSITELCLTIRPGSNSHSVHAYRYKVSYFCV